MSIQKLFLGFFLLSIGLIHITNAYTPNTGDLQTLQNLKTTIDTIISGNTYDNRSFYQQIKPLKALASQDAKISYLLNELESHLYTKFTNEKTKAKATSKQFKQDFLTQYNTGIQDLSGTDNCTGRYQTMDNISFANNFPTALTIATRYRETNCGYYLPKNGDGPFQIISKDYGTGEITEEVFTQSIQEFIDFSKAKHQQYKSKLGIQLSYTGFDYTGIINHAGLYNGGLISGGIVQLNIPKYAFEGTKDRTGSIRHGVRPKFLKTLDREIQNTY